MQEKNATYSYSFGKLEAGKGAGGDGNGGGIVVSVAGLKRELGQTLDSTGLTLWAAAEHMCEYISSNRATFEGMYGKPMNKAILPAVNCDTTHQHLQNCRCPCT